MKAFLICLTTVFLLLASENAAVLGFQDKVDVPSENQVTPDGKIRFTFQDQDWQDVIPWFADQAGYTLQPVDDWPEGTFSLQDEQEYSVIEALDQLNHALRIRKPEPYTLIRNRKMLVLARVADSNFPDELIETVAVDGLDERGFYEIIKCRFDLGDLDAAVMYEELAPMVSDANRRHYSVYPASNQIFVRETGEQLRNIRDLIKAAQMREAGNRRELMIYSLKHQDPETFMAVAGPQLGMPQGATVNEDSTLSITAEPLGNRLFVSGTRSMLTRFDEVAKVVDSNPDDGSEDVALAKPYLKTYPVLVDPKLAFDLLQTMLEGTNARMQQDETSGAITVLAVEPEHKLVEESLGVISAQTGDEFAIIKLEKIEAAEALTILQNIFRQSTLSADEGAPSGPVLLADSYLQQIMVSGTVQEVATVRKIISEVDANYEPLSSGPRSPIRILPMDSQDQERLIPMLSDLLGTTNRSNKFKVILPEDRPLLKDRIRRGELEDPNATLPEEDSLLPPILNSIPRANRPDDGTQWNPSRLQHDLQTVSQWALVGTLGASAMPLLSTSLVLQEDETTGSTSRVQDPEYNPPPQAQSVPGAPIEFRFNEFGLTIETRDLDAADDIEAAIRDFLGEEGSTQLPSFFYLKHRPANEIQQMLEQFYGIGDGGSGGGGGGGGGLMGGMMNNMLGGGGDLLGDLLGGSGSSSASASLEGDVSIGLDVRFNAIWIRGATGNDLAEMTELIEMWDRPEGPTQPELPGVFRTIDVIHRDAAELVDIVKSQIPDLIYDPEAQSARGGGGNNEMAQMMKQLQALTGGKGGGGNNQDVESMKPKAMLGSDLKTNRLLITGPEYIYQEIYDIVVELDTPDLSAPSTAEVLPELTGSKALLLGTIKEMFGDKVVIAGQTENSNSRNQNGSTGGPPGSGGGDNSAAEAMQKQQEAARAAIINAMRAQAAGQSGRGGGAIRFSPGGGPGGGPGGAPGGGGRGGRGGRGGQ